MIGSSEPATPVRPLGLHGVNPGRPWYIEGSSFGQAPPASELLQTLPSFLRPMRTKLSDCTLPVAELDAFVFGYSSLTTCTSSSLSSIGHAASTIGQWGCEALLKTAERHTAATCILSWRCGRRLPQAICGLQGGWREVGL